MLGYTLKSVKNIYDGTPPDNPEENDFCFDNNKVSTFENGVWKEYKLKTSKNIVRKRKINKIIK